MEKSRRLANGKLSEIFGERTINMDKFALTIGYRRVSEGAYKNLSEEDKELFQAYADGVNDYVNGIDLLKEGSTGRLLPPEFYLLGIKYEPWTAVDSLSTLKLLSFLLSWNWN